MSEPTVAVPLDEQRIAERTRILWAVDAQECGACGAPFPRGSDIAGPAIAEDSEWFVDSVVRDGVEMAIIRCPECW